MTQKRTIIRVEKTNSWKILSHRLLLVFSTIPLAIILSLGPEFKSNILISVNAYSLVIIADIFLNRSLTYPYKMKIINDTAILYTKTFYLSTRYYFDIRKMTVVFAEYEFNHEKSIIAIRKSKFSKPLLLCKRYKWSYDKQKALIDLLSEKNVKITTNLM